VRRRGRILAGALASAALAGAAGAAWLRPSACFLADTRSAPPFFCSVPPPSRSERHVPEAGFTVHLYQPARPAHSTLVLVPGLHPLGVADERFQGFAAACAGAGFLVLAPDVAEFRAFRIEATVVDRLARLVHALPRHLPASALENVGLFGISYAGGPVLMAAARPDVARALHFVGAFGGYYDLAHAVDFAVTGAHPAAAELPPPHQWARMVFVAHDAESFLDGPEAQVPTRRRRARRRCRSPRAPCCGPSSTVPGPATCSASGGSSPATPAWRVSSRRRTCCRASIRACACTCCTASGTTSSRTARRPRWSRRCARRGTRT
jgi:hypothetical protein